VKWRLKGPYKRNLSAWKKAPDRKPLILQGARQVGKTWLLKHFGATEFEQVAYFNFEEQPDLKQFFQNTKDIPSIVRNLSLVHGRLLHHKLRSSYLMRSRNAMMH
jgi:predicted AAA+ superfamily ATPase